MIRDNNNKVNRRRVFSLFFLFIVAFGLIVYKLIDIQYISADQYIIQADYQHTGSYELKAKRGKILDRNGIELASSLIEKTITANPQLIKDATEASEKISGILNIDKMQLKNLLSDKSKGFIYVARKVDPITADKISELNIQGINIEDECKRYYPQDELACSLIGFVGTDNNGLSGLEIQYDEILKGIDGKFTAQKDGLGRVIETNENNYIKPIPGGNIVLTIDSSLQFFAESKLKEVAKDYNAPRAVLIVMNPKNGEIYAMTQYPTFNLNNYFDYNQEYFNNLGISFTYEPGSTFKIVNIASAIDNGCVSPNQFFHLSPSIKVGDRIIKEIHRTYAVDYSLQDIIKYSSNVGAVTVALSMGDEILYKNILKFGFGSLTGVNLPGEEKGIISDYKSWPASTIGALAIGQSISVTPLQLLRAACVIANGGFLIDPCVVSEVWNRDGTVEKLNLSQDSKTQIISSATALEVKNMMLSVVEGGTGDKAKIDGIKVCGKTGTAQKANKNKPGYDEGRIITSFLGFAPYENPEVACIVVIDEPQGNEEEIWGGTVAAPIFSEVVKFALSRIN
jgi:cell division protein FtsI/penicillin-binding protein 2